MPATCGKRTTLGTKWFKLLDGLDLDIHTNEYVALMALDGQVHVDEHAWVPRQPHLREVHPQRPEREPLDDDALADIRNREIGFVFQTFNSPALHGRGERRPSHDLRRVFQGGAGREAREVLTQVGLGDRMEHKPNELSGGQRQRVAVARALVMKPSIILADEPTGNLDTATSLEVMQLFSDIQKAGNTVILVTHEEDIAACAHRTVRLRDGKVESDDLPFCVLGGALERCLLLLCRCREHAA